MPHTQMIYDSDDSDFSETDVSIQGHRGGRAHFRRRSISRPRVSETLLSPPPQRGVFRSSSTGRRRDRERDRPVNVMIHNDLEQRSNNASSSKPRMKQSKMVEVPDLDEEEISRSRGRAATGVSREASPYHRDYELAFSQRLLEHDNTRQDLEIFKHQQEIERLERELQKHRERAENPRNAHESSLLHADEDWYEAKISERMRWMEKLEKQERKARSEEVRQRIIEEEIRKADAQRRLEKFEKKTHEEEEREKADAQRRLEKFERKIHEEEEHEKAEAAWRLKKFEESEKEAADQKELMKKIELQKLKELADAQKEKAKRDKLKQEFIEEQERAAREANEKRQQELLMKKAAIEEWKMEQEKAKQRAKEEQEKKDKEFRDRLRHEFGYTEEEIEKMLNKEKKEEKEKKKEHKEHDQKQLEESSRTTWIKVHRKHLLPETLLAYNLPWDWDERDTNYIIIKRWVSEDFQEELFSHTRRIREGKMIAQTSSSTTELKVNDRNKDKMYLVRKKSPSRRLRLFL
ncbi:hypothetical protein N7532_008199 [Penicillium argentinense]|uniref:Uncharacterized protein n=1 Tax=Penicillium argentinense TaxID=1131581 RepID=A0A9W9EX85_9EURO|nr:uncharacterized protein N7532_008199 [Penicillium argentinense]KAJ5089515.1 hypothetical protein N7532_008199 [Penicillium argentinense]